MMVASCSGTDGVDPRRSKSPACPPSTRTVRSPAWTRMQVASISHRPCRAGGSASRMPPPSPGPKRRGALRPGLVRGWHVSLRHAPVAYAMRTGPTGYRVVGVEARFRTLARERLPAPGKIARSLARARGRSRLERGSRPTDGSSADARSGYALAARGLYDQPAPKPRRDPVGGHARLRCVETQRTRRPRMIGARRISVRRG